MSEYRVYCLSSEGRIIKSHEIEAADDKEALAKARALKESLRCELWNRNRLVATLPPYRP